VLIACILNWIWLPEKKRPKQSPLNIGMLRAAYSAIFTSSKYMFAVSGAMLSWSTIITFSIIGPFLIQNALGFSATIYGYSALFIGLGFFLGNILNTRWMAHLSQNALIRIGLFISILASLSLLGMMLFYLFNIWTIMVPSFFVMIGIGFCFPNYYGKAVSVFTEQYVGIANALIGALVLFGTVIYSLILTTLHAHSPVTLGSVYLALSLLNYFIFILVSLKR